MGASYLKDLKKTCLILHGQRPLILISVILVLLLSMGWKVLVCILKSNGKYLFLNRMVYYDEHGVFNTIIVGAIGVILFFIFHNKKARVLISVLCISALLLSISVSNAFWPPDREYFSFVSPDKRTTLIIEECSWLLGGWSNCYVEIKPYLLEKLDSDITTDDGYRPFSAGDYTIDWEDNFVLITYGFGNAGIQKESVLNLSE